MVQGPSLLARDTRECRQVGVDIPQKDKKTGTLKAFNGANFMLETGISVLHTVFIFILQI